MKKTALTILLTVAACVCSFAQTAYDAWLFSENNYEGTARSVAMGNAFTALGGDLGAVSINPAGSAVAGYSQISITPSLTFSTNIASGVPYAGSTDPYFQRTMKSKMTRAGLPNMGFTFNFNTGRKSGLKGVTVGLIINRSNSWCEDVYANGTNSQTSFLAALASDATYEIEDLNRRYPNANPQFSKEDYLNSNVFKDGIMNWRNTVGYRSGMFSAYDADGQKFAAATETVLNNGNLMQSGTVNQTYGRSVYGNKYDYLINVGTNISDFIYIGFNMGINTISYDYTHYFRESAVNIDEFKNTFIDQNGVESTTYFESATYKYSYSAEGTGIFGKLGVIVTPGAGIRLGAAVQTPTSTTIKEQWQDMASTSFSDNKFNGDADSYLGHNEYNFSSPWRANFGAAYTIGNIAVISADYEVAGFGGIKYRYDRHELSEEDVAYFEDVNNDIKESYGAAHYLRLGTEFKPISVLAIRAGYNLGTSAQKKYYDVDKDDYLDLEPTYTQNISLGVGYASKKSFFADLACRYTFRTDEFIYPYSDYLADYGTWSPEIRNTHSNWKLFLTLGWRF